MVEWKEREKRLIAESRNINKIQLKIMNAKYDSYCLYLSIEESQQVKELQRTFYKEFPKEIIQEIW